MSYLSIQFSAAFSTLAFRLAAFPDSAESLKIADMVYLNLYMFATTFVVQKYVNLVGEGGGAQLESTLLYCLLICIAVINLPE